VKEEMQEVAVFWLHVITFSILTNLVNLNLRQWLNNYLHSCYFIQY